VTTPDSPAEPGVAASEGVAASTGDAAEEGVAAGLPGGGFPVRALVVVASNRAAAGVYADRGGPVLVEGLRGLGFEVDGPQVVPDAEVGEALRAAVAAAYDVVLTTGGTGLTPGDLTPEATRPLLDREVPGLAEAIRGYGVAGGVPTAALSRGLAGLAGSTLGREPARLDWRLPRRMAVLTPVLVHAVQQIRGGDHPSSSQPLTEPPPSGTA
jgi:molybdenum cofactor synthesis domain-containing protein